MKILLRSGVLFAFGVLLAISVAGAVGEGGVGWHGLRPLSSSRTEVERLLGPPSGKCRCEYHWQQQQVRIEYAPAPCKGYLLGWKVSPDTVLMITVKPAAAQWSGSTGIDEARFAKLPSRDSSLLYLDAKRGVQKTFRTSGEIGAVRYSLDHTDYLPTTGDMGRRCDGFPPDVGGVGTNEKFDSFTDLSQPSIVSHLDTFAVELMGDETKVGYLVAYAGKVSRKGKALKIAMAGKDYLTTKRGIPGKTIVAIDGGFRNTSQIELFSVAKGAPPPTLQPGLLRSEVRIVRRRKRHR